MHERTRALREALWAAEEALAREERARLSRAEEELRAERLKNQRLEKALRRPLCPAPSHTHPTCMCSGGE